MKEKIIQQGAEAVIIRDGSKVIKRRIGKGYRLAELDEKIRRRRTKSEGRLLEKSEKLINVPRVLKIGESEIEMDFLLGEKLSESLDEMENWAEVCLEIGQGIGKLHSLGIIHGDLTTSNMIWVSNKNLTARELDAKLGSGVSFESGSLRSPGARGGKLYFIDFGLGFSNGRIEDMAVDLHLIKQALEAKHFSRWESFWKEIEGGYLLESSGAKEVFERLEKVEKRGRYKRAE